MANKDQWLTAEDRYGRNVRRMREENGLSQAELAEKLNALTGMSMHPSAIAKIEARDVASPRAIRLNEADGIARALGASLPELLTGPDQEFQEAAAMLERAVSERENAERNIRKAFAILRSLKDEGDWEQVKEGLTPAEAVAIDASRNSMIASLARMEEFHGEH